MKQNKTKSETENGTENQDKRIGDNKSIIFPLHAIPISRCDAGRILVSFFGSLVLNERLNSLSPSPSLQHLYDAGRRKLEKFYLTPLPTAIITRASSRPLLSLPSTFHLQLPSSHKTGLWFRTMFYMSFMCGSIEPNSLINVWNAGWCWI